MCHAISGLPPTGSSGLGVVSVSGRMRSPSPAAKIRARIAVSTAQGCGKMAFMSEDTNKPAAEIAAAVVPDLLARSRAGDRAALDRLFAELRGELKQVARRQRARLDPAKPCAPRLWSTSCG